MSTITRERAQEIFLGNGPEPTASEERELARIALASLEAEPVCVIDQSNLDYLNSGSDADVWPASRTEMGDVLLYRSAPAAPVSVPGLLALDRLAGEMLNHAMNCERRVAVAYTHCAHRLAEEVGDLHAAMLQGAVQPQNQQQNIPENIPANTPCKEAPEHIWLQTAGAWPENGEFSELTWCSDNQHKDDTLYVRADVVTGNSPVIPDGWVMVPVDMTPEQMRAVQIESELGSYATENLSGAYALFREFWDVAVTAAPQQEVKP